MSDDLIERLRSYRNCDEWGDVQHAVCDEAAAELASLRAEVERLTAALSDERAHADALAEALGQAVKALEMVTDQDAIKNTRVDIAYACCVEAAAKGRKQLFDQNPIKTRARRQGAKLP